MKEARTIANIYILVWCSSQNFCGCLLVVMNILILIMNIISGLLPTKIAKNLAKLYLLFLFPSTCSFSSPSSFSSTSSFSSSFPSFTSFIIFPQSIHHFLIFPLLICSSHSAKIHSTSPVV